LGDSPYFLGDRCCFCSRNFWESRLENSLGPLGLAVTDDHSDVETSLEQAAQIGI